MKDKENFLDKNTLIAVALVFVAWLCWESYMRKKYPHRGLKPPLTTEQGENKAPLSSTKSLPFGQKKADSASAKSTAFEPKALNAKKAPALELGSTHHIIKPEQTFLVKGGALSFEISSQGMGFRRVVLNQILDRKGQAVYLFKEGKSLPFETRILDHIEPLHFDIKKTGDYQYEGVALWNGTEIKKSLTIIPDRFLIKTVLRVSGDLTGLKGITTTLNQTEQKKQEQSSWLSLFIPPDIMSFFISSARQGVEQIPLSSKEVAEVHALTDRAPVSAVRTAGLSSRYFGLAWLEEQSDVLPRFQIYFHPSTSQASTNQISTSQIPNRQQRQKEAYQKGHYVGGLTHVILNQQQDFELSYRAFMGPKDFAVLDPSLTAWVDFGWFSSLSRFILKILSFFHSLVGNWGWAIVLLTLLVRLLLLPFVLSSHRSMEVMKKVNPEIQKIRAKFKQDPQRMNQEIMALMKSHKANPLGGCLTLLLQIPVFWALWRALSNSYSLYQAPFLFWIQDLSWKDPYYVLPALMAVFMFIQQKISPVSLSPEMARALQIMPIFMAVFMINLPSGLVLYMLVSALFGLGQQVYLNARSEKGGNGGGKAVKTGDKTGKTQEAK